ncbi:uncharacterized protein RBU33_012105 isoform 2-T2 [Hipposideros larvatus]
MGNEDIRTYSTENQNPFVEHDTWRSWERICSSSSSNDTDDKPTLTRCAMHCFKLMQYINSFNPHVNLMKYLVPSWRTYLKLVPGHASLPSWHVAESGNYEAANLPTLDFAFANWNCLHIQGLPTWAPSTS